MFSCFFVFVLLALSSRCRVLLFFQKCYLSILWGLPTLNQMLHSTVNTLRQAQINHHTLWFSESKQIGEGVCQFPHRLKFYSSSQTISPMSKTHDHLTVRLSKGAHGNMYTYMLDFLWGWQQAIEGVSVTWSHLCLR